MSDLLRIRSVIRAGQLNSSISGIMDFEWSELEISDSIDVQLPTNLRLGHLVEKIVSTLIKRSSNYKMIYENVQITSKNQTLGEIDFILEKVVDQRLFHVELAYKFYLLDPRISEIFINNWIGPNRKDSLSDKLHKLKNKQFPLLTHASAALALKNIDITKVTPALCLLASLYIPYEYKGEIPPEYKRCVVGYYLQLKKFVSLDSSKKLYYLPSKLEWGMNPSENTTWNDLSGILSMVLKNNEEQLSTMCWQKCDGAFTSFFIVWW